MNRIPLNYTQRQSLQPVRKELEAKIRDLKKQLRGQPHTMESSGHQSTLGALKHAAHALYTIIAGARGHEHAPKRTEQTLTSLRNSGRMYTLHFKARRAPGTSEMLGLLLLEAEAKPVAAPATATATAA